VTVSLVTGLVAANPEGGATSFWENAYPIIPHPGELIFGFVAFGILYLVVQRKVVPRLEAMFAERSKSIEGAIAEAATAREEAEAARAEFQSRLVESRAEASRIRQQAQEEGAQIVAEARQRAQDEANRITAAAAQQIQAERQQALVQLRGEVGRLATDLASRIVGESLQDEARQRRVVDRFLGELEAEPVPGRNA
jgi:F-type H+-transporting ATPase subunit b